MNQNYIYILRCSDNTLYTGWTTDIKKRIEAHNNGTGSKYTRARRPVELMYSEEFDNKQDAQRREYKIKQMTRQEKELLIAGYNTSANKVTTLYDTLFAHYGDLHWWPGQTPYEIIVGAILTQNTNWSNVEKAIANFGDNLTPEFVANIDPAELIDIIRPAGFFNQKALYLKAVTSWYADYGYDVGTVQKQPLDELRPELLKVKGVGQETADSILLYAFSLPTFVVDAYTQRLCERYPLTAGKDYSSIKEHFETQLPKSAEVYNHCHALIVINAKEYCKKKPLCDGCPLASKCRRYGI